ncbi:uncharacterized protein LOC143722714 [Siphateles boraxobius]|uniref:uncharacterized protein LOC143722714 n=1 Tax=Siphateles boraxobius TaxID=180520 RepID=UPI00406396A4
MKIFWEALSVERIGRGFVTIPPSFHFRAPWISPKTYRSNHVLNTEYQKVRPPKPTEVSEITVTEDRLKEELYKQKVQVVRNLCKECGIDSSGSGADLLLRLSSEIKSSQTYDKVFQKIWAASGNTVSPEKVSTVPMDIDVPTVSAEPVPSPASLGFSELCKLWEK